MLRILVVSGGSWLPADSGWSSLICPLLRILVVSGGSRPLAGSCWPSLICPLLRILVVSGDRGLVVGFVYEALLSIRVLPGPRRLQGLPGLEIGFFY